VFSLSQVLQRCRKFQGNASTTFILLIERHDTQTGSLIQRSHDLFGGSGSTNAYRLLNSQHIFWKHGQYAAKVIHWIFLQYFSLSVNSRVVCVQKFIILASVKNWTTQ